MATHPINVRETDDDNFCCATPSWKIFIEQLNPLKKRRHTQQLLDEFGVTHDELAAHRPPAALITNMIRLLKLPIPVASGEGRRAVAGHARALLSLEAGPRRKRSWRAGSSREGLSVRATEDGHAGPITRPPPLPSQRRDYNPCCRGGRFRCLASKMLLSVYRPPLTRGDRQSGQNGSKIVVEFGWSMI